VLFRQYPDPFLGNNASTLLRTVELMITSLF
jgi:hypothetical protein